MTSTFEEQVNLQRLKSGTYIAAWHDDWTVGPALHGGCVAAVIRLAALTHLRTDSRFHSQPHLLNLHLDLIRACARGDMTITVTVLKIGAVVSTIQLQVVQDDKVKVIALSNTTNFDQDLGPSIPASKSWTGLLPPPTPKPNFGEVMRGGIDPNWVPLHVTGEILPIMGRIVGLWPRGGFAAPGICDIWYTLLGDEQVDESYVTLMTDLTPSMSDTLLQNGGLHDAHVFRQGAERWASDHPGTTCHLEINFSEAAKAKTLNNTVTLDIEFKRSLPKEGLRFVLIRTETKMLSGGRMDVEVTICSEDMDILCCSRQIILILDAVRRFGRGDKTTASRI